MITYDKSKFIIASKTMKLINSISDALEIVPKKCFYHKNKILSYTFELLDSIYMINEAKYNVDKEKSVVIKDIYMINYLLSYFLDKHLLSKKYVENVLYLLTEISKMTSAWFANMEKQ